MSSVFIIIFPGIFSYDFSLFFGNDLLAYRIYKELKINDSFESYTVCNVCSKLCNNGNNIAFYFQKIQIPLQILQGYFLAVSCINIIEIFSCHVSQSVHKGNIRGCFIAHVKTREEAGDV